MELQCDQKKTIYQNEFKQYMKSDKMPYIIYADIESLIRKVDGCANNPENSSTTKIREHIPGGSYRRQANFISWKRLYEKVL